MSTRTTSTTRPSAASSPPKDSALGYHNQLIADKGVDKATGFSDHGRNARAEVIIKLLEQFTDPDLKIVDYGCNDGQLFDRMGAVYNYVGVDINPAFIKLAKKLHRGTFAKFRVGDALTEDTNDWLIRYRPNVVVASGVLCYRAGINSYPELVYRLYTCAQDALIFNVLVNTRPPDRRVHVWNRGRVLSLVEACGCRSWQIIRSYLSNDMTVVMFKRWTHHEVQ